MSLALTPEKTSTKTASSGASSGGGGLQDSLQDELQDSLELKVPTSKEVTAKSGDPDDDGLGSEAPLPTRTDLEDSGATAAFKLFGTSAFADLLTALDGFHATAESDLLKRVKHLDVVINKGQDWLSKHATSSQSGMKKKKAALDDLLPKALKTRDVLDARAYMHEIESGKYNELDSSKLSVAKNLTKGIASDSEAGFGAKAAGLAATHGLNPVDLMAINAYTSVLFDVTNPAMEDNAGWMDRNLEKQGFDNKFTRSAMVPKKMEEGKRHGKFAQRALDKLPSWSGVVYRGMAADDKRLATYAQGTTHTFKAFSSTSTKRSVGIGFAGQGVREDRPYELLLTMNVTNGKDIQPFSAAPSEGEILLPSNVTFAVAEVKESMNGKSKLYEVVMNQTG
jgi:hypothetical protein